ncbi:MAG: methyltransferase domain-containing protein [Dehalococcoidia bacterium]|nr:methyltransferase domain-containing protein [Dehalococcoidia bacterium]
MASKKIEKCRLCGSDQLVKAIDFGEQYVMGVSNPSDQAQPTKEPLSLVLCTNCSLVQLIYSVDPDSVFHQYWQRSGRSEKHREFLHQVVREAIKHTTITFKDCAVDIGCNDAVLLEAYPPEVPKIGFDPARNMGIKRTSFDTWTIEGRELRNAELITQYFSLPRYKLEREEEKTKIITTVDVFPDMEDPKQFIKDMAEILHPRGTWVNQMPYLPSALKNNQLNIFSHESLTYWNFQTFRKECRNAGLDVYDVQLVGDNDSIIRVFLQQRKTGLNHTSPSVSALAKKEASLKKTMPGLFAQFGESLAINRANLKDIITRSASAGKKTFAFDATAGMSALIQTYGLAAYILCVADRDDQKWGKNISGLAVPIVSPDDPVKMSADFCLVETKASLEEAASLLKGFVSKGGKFITAMPESLIT